MVAQRRHLAGSTFILSMLAGMMFLTGCYSLPQSGSYSGPPTRPLSLDEYYARDNFTGEVKTTVIRETSEYSLDKITIQSLHGPFTVDFYQHHIPSDSVVFVFPVLGGKKNIIENYFAEYFAKHGIEAAIVERNDDFKKPENFDHLEDVMHDNVVRDRMAIDFFEQHYGKKNFGTFGLSRGAINVAMTAGVDARLKYNVMLMGGSDLLQVFRTTDQPAVKKFIRNVMAKKKMTEPEVFDYLSTRIKTDPKYLARFIDGRHSLLMLAQFDHTVPIETGFKLRKELGNPETIVLMANHYTSVAYTGLINAVFPKARYLPLPIHYVEDESLNFFRHSFHMGHMPLQLIPLRVMRYPFDVAGRITNYFTRPKTVTAKVVRTPWDEPVMQAASDAICRIQ